MTMTMERNEEKREEIKANVDKLTALNKKQREVKKQMDELKGYFETIATQDLKDTKIKTIEYWGSRNTKIIVGNSETVKPISVIMLRKVFGEVFPDFVKEKIAYEPTEPCKRVLAMTFLGNYTEGTLEKTIASITADTAMQTTLRKKLKGKYAQDKQYLMSAVGLAETDASDWAYLIMEVMNWEWLQQILKAAEWKEDMQEAIELMKSAIIVDEGMKVTIEEEKEK